MKTQLANPAPAESIDGHDETYYTDLLKMKLDNAVWVDYASLTPMQQKSILKLLAPACSWSIWIFSKCDVVNGKKTVGQEVESCIEWKDDGLISAYMENCPEKHRYPKKTFFDKSI